MSYYVYAKQFVSQYKLDPITESVILKKNKPVFEKTFYKTRQGTTIEVPINGWVVRNPDGSDIAITSIKFGAEYSRDKFLAGHGYAVGNPAKWHRYLKK